MSKSVSYSVVPRKNPQEPEAGVRFYAQAQASGDVTVREMSERIQRTCTVTRADVAAVLTALGRCDCGGAECRRDCASGGFGHVSDWCERQGGRFGRQV